MCFRFRIRARAISTPGIGMLPSPTLLTDQYRDETNGCYVTRSSESILGGSPVVPSPCGCPERSRPAVSCPPCSYRACIGMGRINGSVRGFEVRSNGLCVQSHVAPRDVCSTVHGSPRRNNLLVRMVSYRYRCNVQPLDYRRRSCLMATGWTHPLHLRPVDWNVTFALVG